MITEEALQTLLAEAAAGIDLPPDGRERALAAYRSGADEPRITAPTRRLPGRPVLAVAASFLLVTGVVALVQHHPGGGTSSGTSAATTAPAVGAVAPAGSGPVAGSVAVGSGGTSSAQGSAPAGATGPQGTSTPTPTPTSTSTSEVGAARVVHTATATLQVPAAQVAPTLARLRTLAAAMSGYVQSSEGQLAGSAPTGTVTLRVPAAAYDRARDALGSLGTLTDLTETGQDVTAQYADLTAQETALTTTRDSLLALERRATSVPDVLAVEARLTAVQSQLDVLEGQRKLLADTSADATLTVSVGTPASAPTKPHVRAGWSKAAYDFGHGSVVLLQALLAAAGVALTLFALAGLALLVGLGVHRRWRRRD